MLAAQETDKLPESHLVQCYQADERVLMENAARFLAEGLAQGHSLVIIATPNHRTGFVRELKRIGAIAQREWRTSGLVLLDAADTLAELLVDGEPDVDRFNDIVGTTIREAASRNGASGVHAYGDMVGELWKAKRFGAAARLEGYWNDLQRSIDFDLFCGYPVDVFNGEFEPGAVDALLRAHTHLLPSSPNGDLESALHRAFTELVGPTDDKLAAQIKEIQRPAWASVPDAEAMILWLRQSMPERAPAILARAELYYRLPA